MIPISCYYYYLSIFVPQAYVLWLETKSFANAFLALFFLLVAIFGRTDKVFLTNVLSFVI